MGLGLHGGGVGVAKFFCKQGAAVLVTDLKRKTQLKKSLDKLKNYKIKYTLGKHKKEDFIEADLIIKSPAVPPESLYLAIAKRHKVKIDTDTNLFFKLCKAPIIGVTGTKGKSTIATLIYNFLKTRYRNVILAGNIGVSPLEYLDKIKKSSLVVLELSSFELEDLERSPHIAVINSIFPDHLDRYKTITNYIKAKKTIFKHQTSSDFLILNYDDKTIRNFRREASSKIYFFSISKKQNGCWLKHDKIFFGEKSVCNISDFKLAGKHNVLNILAALTAAKILRVDNKNIKMVASKFKGVKSREELVAIKDGVRYINDTTATMPEAAIAAVRTFKARFPDSKIILIAGGEDKNLKYKNLAEAIKKKVDCLVLLPGTASGKLKKEFKGSTEGVKIFSVKSMAEAVKKANSLAQKGDIVLLSPAAASFNLFKNEFDRGEKFNKEVKKL